MRFSCSFTVTPFSQLDCMAEEFSREHLPHRRPRPHTRGLLAHLIILTASKDYAISWAHVRPGTPSRGRVQIAASQLVSAAGLPPDAATRRNRRQPTVLDSTPLCQSRIGSAHHSPTCGRRLRQNKTFRCLGLNDDQLFVAERIGYNPPASSRLEAVFGTVFDKGLILVRKADPR